MNRDQMSGSYKQLKGKIKETWGNLTDDEIAQFEGNQEQFFGALQRRYGVTKEQAQKTLRDLETAIKAA